MHFITTLAAFSSLAAFGHAANFILYGDNACDGSAQDGTFSTPPGSVTCAALPVNAGAVSPSSSIPQGCSVQFYSTSNCSVEQVSVNSGTAVGSCNSEPDFPQSGTVLLAYSSLGC